MNVKIEESWRQHIGEEFDKQYFVDLTNFVKEEYLRTPCYPPGRLIFNAFNLCPFDDVKVVIIGQDQYREPGQAMGLSFSVPDGITFPPSLINIFKEIQMDLGIPMPATGDLTRWAKQGGCCSQRHVDRSCPSGCEPSAQRLGGVYRCCHQGAQQG